MCFSSSNDLAFQMYCLQHTVPEIDLFRKLKLCFNKFEWWNAVYAILRGQDH